LVWRRVGYPTGADAAVMVLVVVPAHEATGPLASIVERLEAVCREAGPVLGGAKQRLDVGVIVGYAGSRVRRCNAQPVQHRQEGRSLQRRTFVAVQDGALGLRMDALCQCPILAP